MNILDISLFVIKYIPFWTVPMIFISLHFAYLYWLKDYKEMAYIWGIISLFCLTFLVAYFFIGGPDQIIQTFTHTFK